MSPHLGLQLEVSFEFEKAQVLPAAGYATLTRDYAILPMLGRSYWPMLAMLSLPYTGYADAILCWCFILAYLDSNTVYTFSFPYPLVRFVLGFGGPFGLQAFR